MQAIYLLQVFVKLFSKFFILLPFQNPQKPSKNIFILKQQKEMVLFLFFSCCYTKPKLLLSVTANLANKMFKEKGF